MESPEAHASGNPPIMVHDEVGNGTEPPSPGTSQAHQVAEPSGCARARPYAHHNFILRQHIWQDEDNLDHTGADNIAAESYMADIDITTPEIADTTSRMETQTNKLISLPAQQLDFGNSDLTPDTSAAHAINAGATQLNATHRLQV